MTRRKKTKRSFVKSSGEPSNVPNKKRSRPKVPCPCNKCKGKLVDPRTKTKHESKTNDFTSREANENLTQDDLMETDIPSDIPSSDDEVMEEVELGRSSVDQERKYSFLAKKMPNEQSKGKGKQKATSREINQPIVLVEQNIVSDDDDNNEGDNVQDDNNFSDEEEQDASGFNAPESIDDNDDLDVPIVDFNEGYNWIVLWILLYQERHRLSDIATDSLVKFVRYILILLDPNVNFPTSLYMARKKLGVCAHIVKYATCEKCCKLYNITEVSTNMSDKIPTKSNCSYIDFPDHPMENQRKKCNAIIAKKIHTKDGIIYRPSLIFPTISIKHQLQLMYNRKGFEESCRKWTNRHEDPQHLNDIYDGRIWKTFQDPNEDTPFFRKDVADLHLGIMLNLDWFQPFDNADYSVGAIYGVICNLPRSERFKPSNILTLALIPGPNEPSLHRLNHYLAPIIDQLIELWNGVELSKTYESSGKRVRVAVICCSCDIPAARKLCGHISARVACHRCLKRAQYDDRNQPNFGGFDDMDKWFVERDIEQVRKAAEDWLGCNTKDARKNHVSNTLIRWSEMYRLPYFNSVRFLIVDPMHCLFLGIAKWIVTKLWIEKGRLTQSDLEKMQTRAKLMEIPADIGRIPFKIATGEGFSGFTADQWKTFILVYATTITWDLLQESDQMILANFVRACNILVCRSVSNNGLEEAHQRLLTMVKLIEKEYGPEKISPNLHLCLHICECVIDYGPLYSFWCFSFERMNGLLGSFHSSNRRIEPELLKIIQYNSYLDQFSNSQDNQHLSACLNLLASKKSTGSLAIHDELDDFDYREYLSMSRNVEQMAGTGTESFPGMFLSPKKMNKDLPDEVVELLVEYYRVAYNKECSSLKNIHTASSDVIPVLKKANMYGRLQLGSEVFGSSYSKRHIKSAKILSQFTHDNGDKDTYPGIVQFYFEHTVNLEGKESKHSLAFVRWYRSAEDHKTRFHFKINDDDNSCNIELWRDEFFELGRDCIIPIHSILGRYISGTFSVGQRNPRKYMSVIPINRKINIP